MKRFLKLENFNKILAVLTCILSIYIIVSPFLPNVTLALSQAADTTKGFKYQSDLVHEVATEQNISLVNADLKPMPKENTLVIPQIGVDAVIVEGTDPKTLDQGIWRRPYSSTPDKGGNTVLVGHRYMYTFGPKTFYSLDKMKKGDKFLVFWNGKEYDYEVFETEIVDPSKIEIEHNTVESIMTLYTCHPLWTAKNRLVVKARLYTTI